MKVRDIILRKCDNISRKRERYIISRDIISRNRDNINDRESEITSRVREMQMIHTGC